MSGTRSFWRLSLYRVRIVFVIGLTCASVQAEKELVQGKAEVSFHWPESHEELAEANRIPTGEIEGLANQLRPPYEEKLRVGGFVFAELEPGQIDIVAVTNSGNWESLARLVIARSREEGQYRYVFYPYMGPAYLPMEVVDLDGDGLSELISTDFVGGYDGASTVPVLWPTILRVRDNKIVDVSSSFPEYYRQRVLGSLELWKSMPTDGAGTAFSAWRERVVPRLQYVEFRAKRILGEKAAGLDEAIKWSRSEDSGFQRMALDLLKDYPSRPGAKEALERLAESKDGFISMMARQALENQ